MQNWVCARCRAANAAGANFCARCGNPSVSLYDPTLLGASQYDRTVQMPKRSRLSGPWPWRAVLLMVGSLLAFVVALGTIVQPGSTDRQLPARRAKTTISRSDVYRADPEADEIVVKCTLCQGTGRTWRFGHAGDGRDLSQYYRRDEIICPACRGIGMEQFRYRDFTIVPDSTPPDPVESFRIWQSDVFSTDPATGRRLIRCTDCRGTGEMEYWPDDQIARGLPGPGDFHTVAKMPCLICKGTRKAWERVPIIIVPHTRPHDYAHLLTSPARQAH